MNPTRILTVPGVGRTANLKLPTQRCGAVGFLRLQAEEDVNAVTLERFKSKKFLVEELVTLFDGHSSYW